MATLPVQPFGSTKWAITRVGFGAWAAGGGGWSFGWGPQDDEESIAAIRHAVEQGVNWIDTAAAYGLGHSEEVVAEALAVFDERDRPLVFTKGGLVSDPANPMVRPRRVGDPKSLRRGLEESLRRLRVDRVDAYQLHWPPDDGTPVEAYWETFLELEAEGLIAAPGLSNHGVELLERAEKLGHVDVVQPPYSLIRREAGADVIPWSRDHETAVIVYSPMQSGLLSGSFTTARVASLAEDDWRRRSPDFSGAELDANLALAAALEPIAHRHRVETGAVAIAWTLANPGVTGAIVGARSPGQVDGWLPAAALVLSDDDLAEIAAGVTRTGAGSGPVTAS